MANDGIMKSFALHLFDQMEDDEKGDNKLKDRNYLIKGGRQSQTINDWNVWGIKMNRKEYILLDFRFPIKNQSNLDHLRAEKNQRLMSFIVHSKSIVYRMSKQRKLCFILSFW